MLHAAADRLAAARGDLVGVMAHEAGKTPDQSDPEVSELVDFARWYADRALELERLDGVRATPLGVVLVTPPWNFPVAIPGGGCLAALAAGNAAMMKPAPQTPCCAEVLVEAIRGAVADAGLPADLLQLVPVDEGDVGRHLVTHPQVEAVVLTGAYATAELFRSWRPTCACTRRPAARTRWWSPRTPTTTWPWRTWWAAPSGTPGRSAPPPRSASWWGTRAARRTSAASWWT